MLLEGIDWRNVGLAVTRAELTGARLLIEQLKAQPAVLRRMSFGRSSEKLTDGITQLELLLEDLEEVKPATEEEAHRSDQPA